MEQFYLMNKDDRGFPVKLDNKTSIFHYMGLECLLCMLDNSTFYIKRKCYFDDVYENKMLPLKESMAFTALNIPNYNASIVQNEINKKQELFKKESHLLTSCWSEGPNENFLLWKSYTIGKYGVCIKSTIGHVVEAIADNRFEIWCGKMIYRRRNQTDFYDDAKWIKPPEYKGEDEIRFYFVPKTKDVTIEAEKEYECLNCNTNKLIDKIFLSPFLTISESNLIANNLSKITEISPQKIKKSKIEIKRI